MSTNKSEILVLGCKGCGSAIAEAFLTLGGVKYSRQEVDYSKPSPERDRLLQHNPLGQVPTLVLPNGEVLTETLAVAHYVQRLNPKAGLIPNDLDDHTRFSRWSTFLVAAVYPTFTYGDDPAKWLGSSPAAIEALRASTNLHRQNMWMVLEKEVRGEFFLDSTFSAMDVYFAAMIHWRPRQEWFKEHAPKILGIGRRVLDRADLAEVWKLNFG